MMGTTAGLIVLALVIGVLVGYGTGWHLSLATARMAAIESTGDALASGCPTCAQLTGPGGRLGACRATVTRVEVFGTPQDDPVADANSVVMTATYHAQRVRAHRRRPVPTPTA